MMSRLQLAIDVADLAEAIAFYSKMFSTEPSKIRPGYANFAIEEPPLKLVLYENPETGGAINHLGVEGESAAMVADADLRMTDEGLDTTGLDETMCCYADKTETWIEGPDDIRWEWYVKTGDNEQFESVSVPRS